MKQRYLFNPEPHHAGDFYARLETAPFGEAVLARLPGRRVILSRARTRDGRCDGWCLNFKRLASPDERQSTRKRVVVSQMHLSDEAMWAIIELYAEINGIRMPEAPPPAIGA
jgi:hypothetical protein